MHQGILGDAETDVATWVLLGVVEVVPDVHELLVSTRFGSTFGKESVVRCGCHIRGPACFPLSKLKTKAAEGGMQTAKESETQT
jgi:hypothetical protein